MSADQEFRTLLSRRAAIRLGTAVAGSVGLAAAGGGGAQAVSKNKPVWVFGESTYFAGYRTIRLRRLSRGADLFLTIHEAEAADAVAHGGYREESQQHPMWVFPVTDPAAAPAHSTPLLRLWNAAQGRHLHTASSSEARRAVRRDGYQMQPEYPAPYVLKREIEGRTVALRPNR
jgi:hypothetical protein